MKDQSEETTQLMKIRPVSPAPIGVLVAIFLFALSPIPMSAQSPSHLHLQIPVNGNSPLSPDHFLDWIDWLQQEGYGANRCGANPRTGTVFLTLDSEAELTPLLDAGFRVISRQESAPLEGDSRTQSQYFDPGEIAAMLMQTVNDHPGITQLINVGTTFQGRTIFGIEISNQPGVAEDEPAIQFNAAHHSREVATPHIVMDIIDTLTDSYGSNPTITAWVDDYKTVCVPMVNPDGVQYVFDTDSFWRKNRQTYPGGCTGVDLNRNYSYRWGPDRCGFASSCSSSTQTYPGPSEMSELETQAMVGLAMSYHFVMATSYHASGQFIDYPYACSNGAPNEIMPEHLVIHEMMNGMADGIDAVDSTPRYAVFSPASAGALSGDDTSWYYANQGTYSFLVEVGTSFEPSFSLVAGIVNRNRGGWQYLYDRLGEARIDVHVNDACTNDPLEAEVTLLDFVFDTGEDPRSTYLPFGRWTFLVPPNSTYTVRVQKNGYVTQDLDVPVGSSPSSATISLVPDAGCPPKPPTNVVPASSVWTGGALIALFLTFGLFFIIRAQRLP